MSLSAARVLDAGRAGSCRDACYHPRH